MKLYKTINLNDINPSDILPKSRMKNLMGGSITCTVSCYDYSFTGTCAYASCGECESAAWTGCYVEKCQC